jgi:hypothetical protein
METHIRNPQRREEIRKAREASLPRLGPHRPTRASISSSKRKTRANKPRCDASHDDQAECPDAQCPVKVEVVERCVEEDCREFA